MNWNDEALTLAKKILSESSSTKEAMDTLRNEGYDVSYGALRAAFRRNGFLSPYQYLSKETGNNESSKPNQTQDELIEDLPAPLQDIMRRISELERKIPQLEEANSALREELIETHIHNLSSRISDLQRSTQLKLRLLQSEDAELAKAVEENNLRMQAQDEKLRTKIDSIISAYESNFDRLYSFMKWASRSSYAEPRCYPVKFSDSTEL